MKVLKRPPSKDYSNYKIKVFCLCQAVLEVGMEDIKYEFTPAEPEETPADFDRHDYYIICPCCKGRSIIVDFTTEMINWYHNNLKNQKRKK